MLRKVVLASIAAAGFGLAVVGSAASAQAQSWREGGDGDRAYGRNYHDGGWDRRRHWRHHHHRYDGPPWRRWHWSRHAPPPGHYHGHPVPPRPYW